MSFSRPTRHAFLDRIASIRNGRCLTFRFALQPPQQEILSPRAPFILLSVSSLDARFNRDSLKTTLATKNDRRSGIGSLAPSLGSGPFPDLVIAPAALHPLHLHLHLLMSNTLIRDQTVDAQQYFFPLSPPFIVESLLLFFLVIKQTFFIDLSLYPKLVMFSLCIAIPDHSSCSIFLCF